MTAPNTGLELLTFFIGYDDAGYENPIQLKDTSVGFSIQRNYPVGIRFKPAIGRQGDDDVAVIWIVYEPHKRATNADLIPLRLRIATMSKYRAAHWDYNFEDENCPTEDSVLLSKSTPRPLELNLANEYYYSEKLERLVNSKGSAVKGREVLNQLFNAHCDSVHPLKGIRWQGGHKLSKFIRWFFDQPVNFLLWLLTVIFGRTLDEQRDRSIFLDGYLWTDFKKVSLDSIEIAGYRASRRVVVLFLFIVVAGCVFLLPSDEKTYIGSLVRSEFLLAIHSLILLLFLDELLPAFLFELLNRSIRLRKWYLNLLLVKSIF
jgi:hypothetical protein